VASVNEHEQNINHIQPIVDEMEFSQNRILCFHENCINQNVIVPIRAQTEVGEDRGVVSVIFRQLGLLK